MKKVVRRQKTRDFDEETNWERQFVVSTKVEWEASASTWGGGDNAIKATGRGGEEEDEGSIDPRVDDEAGDEDSDSSSSNSSDDEENRKWRCSAMM